MMVTFSYYHRDDNGPIFRINKKDMYVWQGTGPYSTSMIHFKGDGTLYTQDNLFHRADGPALIYDDGYEEWYINGKDISEQVQEMLNEYNLPLWKDWTDEQWVLFKLTFC